MTPYMQRRRIFLRRRRKEDRREVCLRWRRREEETESSNREEEEEEKGRTKSSSPPQMRRRRGSPDEIRGGGGGGGCTTVFFTQNSQANLNLFLFLSLRLRRPLPSLPTHACAESIQKSEVEEGGASLYRNKEGGVTTGIKRPRLPTSFSRKVTNYIRQSPNVGFVCLKARLYSPLLRMRCGK